MSVRVWSNLDFEYELAAGLAYRPGPQLQKLCDRWKAILRLIPDYTEAQLGPGDGGRLLCWGVTPRVEAISGSSAFPSSKLVKSINDKRFSHRLEVEFGCALAGAQVVHDMEQLELAVESCPHDWVVKHPFGVGGRERVTGKGGRGLSDAGRWAEARFREGWSLLFEPWAYRRREFSFHYQIQPDKKIDFVGHCGLVSDESGAFRGNRVLPRGQVAEGFESTTLRAVERLAELGYWGPVGIDAFVGELGEAAVTRPLMEINARYSFGRLALELGRWIPEGWCLQWWHPKRRRLAEVEARCDEFPPDVGKSFRTGVFQLPRVADPEGGTGSYLVVARDPEMLDELTSS